MLSQSFLLLRRMAFRRIKLQYTSREILAPASFQQEKSDSKFRFFLMGDSPGAASWRHKHWSSNKEVLGLFHDDGYLAVIAKSLSDGTGYRIISLPTASDQTKYPFLYSYILSWLWSLNPKFPDNIGLLKAANAAFLAVSFRSQLSFLSPPRKGRRTRRFVIRNAGVYQSGCVFIYRFHR